MPKKIRHHRTAGIRANQTKSSTCVLCGKAIPGPPTIMRLQITSEEPRFIQKAKELGFNSDTWRQDGSMTGTFHKDCFERASVLWKIAFETRAVSPRR